MDKNTLSGNNSDNPSYSNVDNLVSIRDIQNFIKNYTYLVRDTNRNRYFRNDNVTKSNI